MLAGKNNEEKIWNYLKYAGLNDFGTAGLMGNLYAESGLIPNNVENLYEKRLGVTDASYTAAVDSGKYQFFATDKAGYGLAQWTYCSRKAELLDYAQCCRKSIGDLEMQLDFLMKELREGYKAVLAVLKTAGSVRAASDAVLLKFERPADQSEAAQARRAAFGQKYYDKYAAGSAAGSGGKPMTEQEQRQKIVSIAQSYIGCKESDGSHRKIIDLYNSHKPLARGYAVKYTDAWCSTFASAVAIAAGMTDIIPESTSSCSRSWGAGRRTTLMCRSPATIFSTTGRTAAWETAPAAPIMWASWKRSAGQASPSLRATTPTA